MLKTLLRVVFFKPIYSTLSNALFCNIVANALQSDRDCAVRTCPEDPFSQGTIEQVYKRPDSKARTTRRNK